MNFPEKNSTYSQMLDPQKLMQEAQAIVGLLDFGDLHFVKPFTRLLERAVSEVNFHDQGIAAAKENFLRYLINRLRTQDDIKKHPEILEEDVSDPIIIIGLPHSGTTKMQRMMASAPEVQKLYMWRMMNPARFPEAIPGQPDPRMAASGLEHLAENKDDTHAVLSQAAHKVDMNLVDEEFVLFDLVLDESVAGFDCHLPLFCSEDWILQQERQTDRNAYQYVKTLLKYMQWQDGGKRKRPWIMKAVFHIAHMDMLVECFPKATFIHCHRHPYNAIPAISKGMWAGWSTKGSVDKRFVGQQFLKWGSTAINRYLEVRGRLKLDDRIVDVKYDDIRNNIMPHIKDAYSRAGWEMTKEAEQAMIDWELENEQGKHGKNVYSLDEFGLSSELIDEAFPEYIQRFINQQDQN